VIPLALACIWLVAANVIAILPSKDHHWRAAYALIALGIPLLGWATYENGPWWGLALLAAGASVLRWPVIYLWRWLRRQVAG
jgi:membrane protease YdiL (CAAX protease family)